MKQLRILVVEPWLGGSHQGFWNAWSNHSSHAVEIVGLPARDWKWRMRAGAFDLAARLRETAPPDLLVVSDYLDLPAFLGFLPPAFGRVPALVYFHENQLTYPGSRKVLDPERDLHYGYTNILTCLRADGIVFNSRFHLRDFRQAAGKLLAVLPHPNPRLELEGALSRARVIPPGVEVDAIPEGGGSDPAAPLRILFNHRWEHDKDPVAFLRAVSKARLRGACLELVLLGETFDELPEGAEAALASLDELIVHRGYLPSRSQYATLLGRCDVVVSTARHEFFGVAVMEALAAGVTPLLPNRLSYPELLANGTSAESLYDTEEDLVDSLVRLARNPDPLRDPLRRSRNRALAERWSIGASTGSLDAFCAELA